jgi:chromosomal replication initiation ATPase DnaA
MKTKQEIEKAVCNYFKVDVKEIYTSRSSKYPFGIAKEILMYLLFANGHKSYHIAEWFGFAPTMVYRHCGAVQAGLKSDTKIKEDIEKINQQLNI